MKSTFIGSCFKFQPNSDFSSCAYYDPSDNSKVNGFCTRPDMYRCVSTLGKIIPLSYSSVSDFLTCRHLYYLKAIRGIRMKDAAVSSPLKMGTLWDKVLQKYLGNKSIDIPAIINQYEIDDKDTAKVQGLYRAYKALDIQVEPGYDLQAKIDLTIPFDQTWPDGSPVEMMMTGFYDRKYADHFVENKLSGRPEFYQDPFFIQSQIGTYFLADPNLKHVTMEIIRTPALKSTGKNKEESAGDYGERVYQDAISRPSHYFIGWNSETKTYGRRFYRKEFDLEEIKSRYLHVFKEIYNARFTDGFYKNDRVCNNVLPGIACDMLSVCRYNNMSESIYEIRNV